MKFRKRKLSEETFFKNVYLKEFEEEIKKRVMEEVKGKVILHKMTERQEEYNDFELFNMLCTIIHTDMARWEDVKKLYENIFSPFDKEALKLNIIKLNALILMIKNLDNVL